MLEDGAEEAGGAVPPPVVDADGEEVVGAVVGGGDGVEHLLNVRGCGLFGSDAGGAGSGGAFVFSEGIHIWRRTLSNRLPDKWNEINC